jgi:hypothetical protein
MDASSGGASSTSRKRAIRKSDSEMEKGNNDQMTKLEGGTPLIEASTTTIFSPVVSLPILVFIDMFAVALVVPLLFQYYKRAGVTSATQRELLSSLFSGSQIVGGKEQKICSLRAGK